MALLKVIPYGNSLLRRQSDLIDRIDDDVLQLIENMAETIHAAEGVGLAAPQVGQSRMLFLIDWSLLDDGGSITAYINPEIIDRMGKTAKHDEGCLSFPQTTAEVLRPDQVNVKYQTIDGNSVEETLSGFSARVFQHEYDHLLGILFIDRISPEERFRIKDRLQAIMNGEIQPFDGIKPETSLVAEEL